MNPVTSQQIQDKYASLSKELQDAISSPDIHATIQRIGRDNGLMLDQVGELVDQVGLVMLGLSRASDFVSDTAKRLDISTEKAKALAVELNDQVLGVVRTKIEMNSRETEAAIGEVSAPAMESRSDMIAAIENPAHVIMSARTEPLIDRLLTGSSAVKEQKVSIKAPVSAPTTAPKAALGFDPYKEAIE